jgi:ketosteroid isomerase-like protein
VTDDPHAVVDSVLRLWQRPWPDGAAARDAFGRCYADPVTVNGTPMALADLITRARVLHAAYSELGMELLDVVGTADRVVVAFVMHARHTGPLATPLGLVAATGRPVTVRTIDVLTVRDGLITDITVVADEFGVLTQLGALRLVSAP